MADAAASPPSAPAAPIAVTPPVGLSSAQVGERRSRGLTNAGGERTSRSVPAILRANVFTRFNLILGVLLAVVLVRGEPQDALFGIVLVSNALIGIGQELRAKRTLDRLAVLSALPTPSGGVASASGADEPDAQLGQRPRGRHHEPERRG
jgi:cation-transporting P-type ATPase E